MCNLGNSGGGGVCSTFVVGCFCLLTKFLCNKMVRISQPIVQVVVLSNEMIIASIPVHSRYFLQCSVQTVTGPTHFISWFIHSCSWELHQIYIPYFLEEFWNKSTDNVSTSVCTLSLIFQFYVMHFVSCF